ncbi:MAG: hypothetical protein ABIO39_05820 [Caulobacteraceae bacterium]
MAKKLPAQPPPTQDAGEMWLRLFHESAHAWAEASIGCAMTLAQIGAAQARAFHQLTGLSGWRGTSWLQSPDEMLREQFLFAEDQVERLADAARTTMDDLKHLREQPARDILP